MQSYYNVYGGGAQYPVYGGGAAGVVAGAAGFYPYLQVGHGTGASSPYANGFGLQYSHVFPYSTVSSAAAPQQQYGGPVSLPPTPPPAQAGVTISLAARSHRHYRIFPNLLTSSAPEQPTA
ncbi:hypothetical protein ACLOJK_016901 [Asimina triloba]